MNAPETEVYCVSSSPFNMCTILQRISDANTQTFRKMTDFLNTGKGYKVADFEDAYARKKFPYDPLTFAETMVGVIRVVGLRLPEVLKHIWSDISVFADMGGGSGYACM